jgi:hypothetical protein
MSAPVWIRGERVGKAKRSGEHMLRRVSAARRPLPDFLIIGAQKAGTTSLHAYLAQHSRVVPPVTKEVHFFDHEFGCGTDWYRAHFQKARGNGYVTGESTPYYLFHPLAPERVVETLPECLLIVLLRDPVDRAFSHHNHECALGFESLSFEEAIAAEPERLAREEARLLADPAYRSFAHQHHSYLARGRYAEQLEHWLEAFDRDRVLVLGAEDLFADPRRAVEEAQEFLGLPIEAPTDVTAKNARAYAPISKTTRAELDAVFEPHDERLRQLLGRDLPWR